MVGEDGNRLYLIGSSFNRSQSGETKTVVGFRSPEMDHG